MTESFEEERQRYCKKISKLIENTENYVKDVCSLLGWSVESLEDETEPFIICPFNVGHRVPERTIEKHLEKCEWKVLGYTKECKPLSEPTLPLESPSTIKFDIQLQHKILQEAKQKNPELNIESLFTTWKCEEERLIPQTSDRLTSDFTCDERKALYEYVIANTVGPDIGQHDITDINRPDKANVTSTPIIELLAQERNLKRRRAKHRGVHTNKKSQTEILREVIEQQMEMYKEHLSEKLGIPISDISDENKFNPYNIKNEKSKRNTEIYSNENSNSSSKYMDHKSGDEENQYHTYKNKYDSWAQDEKPDRNFQYYDKDCNISQKHTSQSHDYKNKKSSRENSYYEKDRDKYDHKKHYKNDFWDNKYDDSDRHDKKLDKNDSRDRKSSISNKKYDCESRGKKRAHSDSREKRGDEDDSRRRERDNSDSRDRKRDESVNYEVKREKSVSRDSNRDSHRKRDRSKSNEKDCNDVSENRDKYKNKHREKHKKESKKRKKHARDKSSDSDEDRRHKSPKRKRDKRRSRSCS